MYGKDKTETLTIRLTAKQSEFISMLADTMGTNKTSIVRGYINKAMGSKDLYEYKQTDFNDKL